MPAVELRREPFLPDLCRVQAVFFLVLVGELLALVIVLLQTGVRHFNWAHLSLLSLYIQWIVLLNGAVLCVARRFLADRSTAHVAVGSFLLILLTTAAVSVPARMLLPVAGGYDVLDSVADILVAAILAGIALRYFFLQYELRLQQQAELQSRLDALQARMRPHFLFNSMNTIAGMIGVDPQLAEEMIEDLAVLFRGAMANERIISLQEDIGFARSYLNIEQRRLGDRLAVDWHLDPGLESVRVPVLLLQPLLENAVYHGIQPMAEGGTIEVLIKLAEQRCHITVSNPVVGASHTVHLESGQGMALENTRRRLEALYPGKAKMEAGPGGGCYQVDIEIPLEAK
jgi:two-component system sensor histidine kinase AlgZ